MPPMMPAPRCLVMRSFVLIAALLPASPSPGGDDALRPLVERYERAKRALTVSRRRSLAEAVGEDLRPLLLRIGRLGTDAALRFLEREYRRAGPYAAVACAEALLASGSPKAAAIVVAGYGKSRTWNLHTHVRVLDALARSGGEDGLAFVLKVAERDPPERAAIAMGSLALRPRDDRALDALLGGLGHRAEPVRRAALRALPRFRVERMVPALIDRLEREKVEKLRIETLQLLVDLTGQNMGLVPQDWRNWWEVARPRFTFAEEGAHRTRVLPHDLRYFGIEVTSKRLAFLVDASNSMLNAPAKRRGGRAAGRGKAGRKKRGRPRTPAPGSKIAMLKEELTRVLRELPEDAEINIVAFNKVFIPWKEELHPLRGGGRGEAIAYVRKLRCAWGTNIYDTLAFALQDRRVDTIYLLSDGKPVGGTFSRPADILREIGAINRVRGATIHTIGFGVVSDFLKRLAARNGGVYRCVNGR